jgi:opacity protein-like surface antigen
MRRFFPVLWLSAAAAWAEKPIEVRATAGHAAFLDESYLHHVVAGGAARFYLTRRLSFEPEFVYMRAGRHDQDFFLMPNLAFDLSRSSRVRPYVLGGAGGFWSRQRVGTGPYTSFSSTWGVGIGTKIFVTDRIFVAPEVRFGVEPFFRITGSIGWVIRR